MLVLTSLRQVAAAALLCGLIGAACNPSAAPATQSALPATAGTQAQTIHVIEHATNVSHVPVGSLTSCSSPTGCQGDNFAGDDPLFDAASGTQVGTFLFECFLDDPGSGLFHCPGITITLDGRGQIVTSEFFKSGDLSSQAYPITGGSGEFLGATGTVTRQLMADGDGDFVIALTK